MKITHHRNHTFSLTNMDVDTFDAIMKLIDQASGMCHIQANRLSIHDPSGSLKRFIERRAEQHERFAREIQIEAEASSMNNSYFYRGDPGLGKSVTVPSWKEFA